MWWYLTPLFVIVYLGMAFISGPIYVRVTHDLLREGDDTFVAYTVAAVFWPVCLPISMLYTLGRSLGKTGVLWMKYAKFLENRYKKQHGGKFPQHLHHRDYY